MNKISTRKLCPFCDEVKQKTEFYQKQSKCKKCIIKYQKQYYRDNREKILNQRKNIRDKKNQKVNEKDPASKPFVCVFSNK